MRQGGAEQALLLPTAAAACRHWAGGTGARRARGHGVRTYMSVPYCPHTCAPTRAVVQTMCEMLDYKYGRKYYTAKVAYPNSYNKSEYAS